MNIKHARLQKALDFLLHDGFVIKDNHKYYTAPKKYFYNKAHYDAITEIRKKEIEQMKAFTRTEECYSKFLVNCLDDMTAEKCGNCANCLHHDILPGNVSEKYLNIAAEYLDSLIMTIEPRKMWAMSAVIERSKIKYINQNGICLAKYGDPGYGELVKRGKYSKEKRFCDELVGKSAAVIRDCVRGHGIRYITCVPSLRSDLVRDFSMRLAEALDLTFVDLLVKISARQQKEMENSAHQCANAYRSFSVLKSADIPEKVILVDDIIDSKWTMTVCGYKIMKAGCKEVYPYALADSS